MKNMLGFIKSQYPIHVHAFSPPEIEFFSRMEGIGVGEVITRLRLAGLNSIPGGGAEILVDSVRQRVSPRKCHRPNGWASWGGALSGPSHDRHMMFGHERDAKREAHAPFRSA